MNTRTFAVARSYSRHLTGSFVLLRSADLHDCLPPCKGNGGGPWGRDFAPKYRPVNKWQTISAGVGRLVGTWSEAISQQNQPTRQTTLYVPLPMFVVFAAVEIRRRMSNSSSRCRNPLNYVERQRKLLVLWRKARNIQKPSNNGSLRPKDRFALRRGKKTGQQSLSATGHLAGDASRHC